MSVNKRILITEISGDCRNLRITDDGIYCAAYPHGGWKRIEPKDCEKCERDKSLVGIAFDELVEKMSEAACQFRIDSGLCRVDCTSCNMDLMIEEAIKAVLEDKA